MFPALHSAPPESTGWECDGGHRPGWQGAGAGGNDAPSLEMPASPGLRGSCWATRPEGSPAGALDRGRMLFPSSLPAARGPGVGGTVCAGPARAPAASELLPASCRAWGAAQRTSFSPDVFCAPLGLLSATSENRGPPLPTSSGAAERDLGFPGGSGQSLNLGDCGGWEVGDAQPSFNQQETPPFPPKLFAWPVNQTCPSSADFPPEGDEFGEVEFKQKENKTQQNKKQPRKTKRALRWMCTGRGHVPALCPAPSHAQSWTPHRPRSKGIRPWRGQGARWGVLPESAGSSVQSPVHMIRWHVNYPRDTPWCARSPRKGRGVLSNLNSLGSPGWGSDSGRSVVAFLKGFYESIKKEPLAT